MSAPLSHDERAPAHDEHAPAHDDRAQAHDARKGRHYYIRRPRSVKGE